MLILTKESAVSAWDALCLLVERAFQEYGRRYICIDLETEPKDGAPADDALIYGRGLLRVFSIGVFGQSFSFPTSRVSPQYPTSEFWSEAIISKMWEKSKTDDWVIVCHNSNYDLNVLHTELGLPIARQIWCTMIGAWAASPYLEKSLKARAYRYGRVLTETKHIDFSNLRELAEYAEQDIVQTEELFLAQHRIRFRRPDYVFPLVHPKASYKSFRIDQLIPDAEPLLLPTEPIIPEDEKLTPFSSDWVARVEFPILRSTLRAERRGFPFILDRLRSIRSKVNEDKKACLKTIYGLAGEKVNISSNPQMSKIFTKLGIQNPYKTRKAGKASFDAKSMHLIWLATSHPFVEAVMKLTALKKMSSVYTGDRDFDPEEHNEDCGLEYYYNPDTGCIHCSLATVGAVTGRSSCSSPNLQQVPSRKDAYGLKRAFGFEEDDEYSLIVLDHSQLELRVMAALCRDPRMCEILRDRKGDLHQFTADMFGVPRDPDAKQLNFLLLYGGQARMMASQLTFSGSPTTEQQCAQYIVKHTEVYPRVSQYRGELLQEHQKRNHVTLLLKRQRHLPGINWNDDYSVHKAETTLSNNAVQGSGQDLLKAGIVRLDYSCYNPDSSVLEAGMGQKRHRAVCTYYARKLERYRKTLKAARCQYLLQVHDELIFRVRREAAEECAQICAEVMSWEHYMPSIYDEKNLSYPVPFVAEGGVAQNWKDAKSKDKARCHVKVGYDTWEKFAEV